MAMSSTADRCMTSPTGLFSTQMTSSVGEAGIAESGVEAE